jgi:hypothetical protein
MKAQRKAACQLTATATHRRVAGVEVALDPAELFQFLERSTIAGIGHDTCRFCPAGFFEAKTRFRHLSHEPDFVTRRRMIDQHAEPPKLCSFPFCACDPSDTVFLVSRGLRAEMSPRLRICPEFLLQIGR